MKAIKKFGIIVLSAALLLGCLGFPTAAFAAFSGGSGTAGDPFIIRTPEQLDAARDYLTSHFKLGNDIDLTRYLEQGGMGYAKWNIAGWEPIGTYASIYYGDSDPFFTGSFDGNGYKITGLWINRASESYVGLFGAVKDVSVIRNLGVEFKDGVRGNNYVGGLIGYVATYITDSVITNCYAEGSIQGNDYVGGLLGGGTRRNDSYIFWSIEDSYASCDVIGRDRIGILAGELYGVITKSYAVGSASGNDRVGGLVGSLVGWWTTDQLFGISGSYATASVSGNDYVGGLAGRLAGVITDSYATGSVSGNDRVGGLAGYLAGELTYSHATGSVSGNNYVGGLTGYLIYTALEGTDTIVESHIENCCATGNVTGDSYVGGLIGERFINLSADTADVMVNNYRYEAATVNGAMQGHGNPNSDVGGVAAATHLTMRSFYDETLSWLFEGETSEEGETPIGGLWLWDDRGFPKLGMGNEEFPFPFSAAPEIYTVTFDARGGSSAAPISDVRSGSKITKPVNDPTRTGFVFTGWYRDAAATVIWNFNSDTVTGNITLFAGWRLIGEDTTTYTVTFDSQGGGAVPQLSAQYGAKIARPADPIKTGYVFTGWYRDAAATVIWNFNSDTVTGSITLYAGWQSGQGGGAETFTVTFDSQGGSYVAPVTVQTGSTIAHPVEPARSGYTFTGWYRRIDGTGAWIFSSDTVTNDITLYAGWSQSGGGSGGGGGCSAAAAPMLLLFLAAIPMSFIRKNK